MRTRREFVGGATALAASPNAMPACDGAATDPIIALIDEEKRWRLLAVAARARAERLLFAFPKDERPEEFDDHPGRAILPGGSVASPCSRPSQGAAFPSEPGED